MGVKWQKKKGSLIVRLLAGIAITEPGVTQKKKAAINIGQSEIKRILRFDQIYLYI